MSVIDLAEYRYKMTLDTGDYDKSMENVNTQTESMKSRLSGLGTFLKGALVAGLAAVGVAVGATVVEGVKSAAELEEQLKKFQSATGATTKEVEDIHNLAKDLYKTNTDSMEDIVATSEAMVKQMGMTTDEVEKYQQAYMDYAKTTGQANTDVIGAIDDIGDAWGLTADESAKSLDMLKKSNEEYGTDISAVQGALSSVAPAAKAVGLSLEETNGYMNLFAASGLDANQAITAFTYAAKQVESPEQFKQMVQEISAISDPTARAQKAVELFGSKAGVAMANVDASQLNDFIITMDEASGTVTNASEAFDSSFNVQLELMKKQFSGLTIEIGEKLLPIMNDGLSWVSTNMPKIVSTVDGALSAVSSAITPVITIVKTMTGTFTESEGSTSTSFNSIKNTVTSVIDTIKSTIDAFVVLFNVIWEKWGSDIVAFTQQYFNDIMNVIKNVMTVVQNIIKTITALLSGDWQGFFSGLASIATSVMNLIKSIINTNLNFISGIFSGIFQVIRSIVSTVFSGIVSYISGAMGNIGSFVSNGINIVINTFSQLPGRIQEFLSSVINNVASWGSNLASNGRNAINTMINGITNAASGIWNSMVNIGSNIVNGVWEGISGMAETFTKNVRSFFTGIVNSVKKTLGIHSPSKVFEEEVGKYMALGVGEGFTNEMDNVNDMIKNSINTDFNIKSNLLGNTLSASSLLGNIVLPRQQTVAMAGTNNTSTISIDNLVTINGSINDINLKSIQKQIDTSINNAFKYINQGTTVMSRRR